MYFQHGTLGNSPFNFYGKEYDVHESSVLFLTKVFIDETWNSRGGESPNKTC